MSNSRKRYFFIGRLELLQLGLDVLFQVGYCGGYRLQQVVQLALKFLYFPIDDLLIHLPPRFLIYQVVVNVLFL